MVAASGSLTYRNLWSQHLGGCSQKESEVLASLGYCSKTLSQNKC